MEFEILLMRLRAISESSRLRILFLCRDNELSVSEIVFILQQSQPRVSRHLKLLVEVGLLSRTKEGAMVFYTLSRQPDVQALVQPLLSSLTVETSEVRRDLERYQTVVASRIEAAQQYFQDNASHWQTLRREHMPYLAVEQKLSELFSTLAPKRALDLGTGTGRMLELLAPFADEALGIDLSRDMLAVARSNLLQLPYAHVAVKQGNMYETALPDACFDLVVMHMVLHYAEWPGRAIAEAERVLRAEGSLIIVDFLTHQCDQFRDQHQHRWLGFDDSKIKEWCATQNLTLGPICSLEGETLTVRIWHALKHRTMVHGAI